MNDYKFNVLVTGAGGDIAQSISKILVREKLNGKLIGTDIDLDNAGKFFFEKVLKVSPASANTYIDELRDIIERNDIDIFIPTTEAEIKVFFEKNILEKLSNAYIVLPNKDALQIGLDKLATINFLKENGLPYPKTCLVKDIEEPFFPAVMKSRFGSGSKTIIKIEDNFDFNYYAKKFPDYIYQEFITGEDEEYTCGLFRNRKGELARIIFRRKLKDGFTNFGECIKNETIAVLLENFAKKLSLVGSVNVQLRLRGGVPIIFEMNSRFSSTIYLRHLLEFKDLIWSIFDKINIPFNLYYRPPESYAKVYKVYDEFVEFF
ncbi:MAG: ATP-grasp domain-containing protein [Raineya sp.]|nr:ATP-grasp domain-containing protein [Raineya sp.]